MRACYPDESRARLLRDSNESVMPRRRRPTTTTIMALVVGDPFGIEIPANVYVAFLREIS